MPSTVGSRQVPKGTLRITSLRPGTVILAGCPARLAIEIISSKWAVVTLFALGQGPLRHGDLVHLIGGVSRKVLTQTLRRLQEHGLVDRQVYAEAPPPGGVQPHRARADPDRAHRRPDHLGPGQR